MPPKDRVLGDIPEMRRLARTFERNAGKLREIIQAIEKEMGDSDRIWTGPAAERFRSDWQNAQPAFKKMSGSLDDASKAVTSNAERIEAAGRP